MKKISKAQVKFIKSLQLKKYRKQEKAFFVEGEKSVLELLNSNFTVLNVVATEQFIDKNAAYLNEFGLENILLASEKELVQMGTLSSNNAALAVANSREYSLLEAHREPIILALDDIRDPGNLGTIIRTADWFGVHCILASLETADFYNPKTLISSMGSFTRVKLIYTNLSDSITKLSGHTTYGAFLEGENVHQISFSKKSIIVMGNESRGVNTELEGHIDKKVNIPGWGRAESLNVAISTSIILDNYRRSNG